MKEFLQEYGFCFQIIGMIIVGLAVLLGILVAFLMVKDGAERIWNYRSARVYEEENKTLKARIAVLEEEAEIRKGAGGTYRS